MRPPPRIPKAPLQHQRKVTLRLRVKHLRFIRELPCARCGSEIGVEAAHVRSGADGGVGLKPSSRFTVPLCHPCHMEQHRLGENTFWSSLNIDALDLTARLWAISGDLDQGRRAVARARQMINLKRRAE